MLVSTARAMTPQLVHQPRFVRGNKFPGFAHAATPGQGDASLARAVDKEPIAFSAGMPLIDKGHAPAVDLDEVVGKGRRRWIGCFGRG